MNVLRLREKGDHRVNALLLGQDYRHAKEERISWTGKVQKGMK